MRRYSYRRCSNGHLNGLSLYARKVATRPPSRVWCSPFPHASRCLEEELVRRLEPRARTVSRDQICVVAPRVGVGDGPELLRDRRVELLVGAAGPSRRGHEFPLNGALQKKSDRSHRPREAAEAPRSCRVGRLLRVHLPRFRTTPRFVPLRGEVRLVRRAVRRPRVLHRPPPGRERFDVLASNRGVARYGAARRAGAARALLRSARGTRGGPLRSGRRLPRRRPRPLASSARHWATVRAGGRLRRARLAASASAASAAFLSAVTLPSATRLSYSARVRADGSRWCCAYRRHHCGGCGGIAFSPATKKPREAGPPFFFGALRLLTTISSCFRESSPPRAQLVGGAPGCWLDLRTQRECTCTRAGASKRKGRVRGESGRRQVVHGQLRRERRVFPRNDGRRLRWLHGTSLRGAPMLLT